MIYQCTKERGFLRMGVRGVENGSFLIPQRSDEVSSTLPRLEDEPQNSSYAAAGGVGGENG